MAKRKIIDTSLAAYHSLDQEQITETKRIIMEALMKMGRGTSEQIATFLGKPPDVIWKRCSDLKNEKKIFASDFKVLTKRNRFARQWMICDSSQPKVEKRPEKSLPGKTISQYSKGLIRQYELFSK